MKIGESHSLSSQLIHARCLIVGVRLRRDTGTSKSHVIDHYDDKVGPLIRSRKETDGKKSSEYGKGELLHWIEVIIENA